MEAADNELKWRKARASGSNGDCVEIGTTPAGHAAGIRDSKSPERGMLTVTPDTLEALLASVKRGELNLT
ncbi:MAG TPA: DUF397 domain-containing protein [Streptosporangiaceae bacterium]|jgi:hypothetical protein